ncbi:helix-turn-helix transcriptional regulator [Elizabethkingia anophelis]|nr:helix-turn-helix transcriptional regulator [Elizabethkingia anophelis]MDV3490940.1 transcriptional regulator [Elizabethkingia anophelis]
MEKKKLNRIKIVLVEKSVSQKELAEHLKTGVVSVSRWCNNEAQPSLETFYRIAEYLSVDVCELLIKRED